MTIKERLKSYKDINFKIETLEEERAAIENKIYRLNSLGSGMPKGSGIKDNTKEIAIALADNAMKISREIEKSLVAKKELEIMLELLEPFDQAVIKQRYFLCKQWMDISIQLDISYSHLFRKHEEILNKLENGTK